MPQTSAKAGKTSKNGSAQYLGCYIPEDLKSALQAKAEHEGVSVSELVKGLIEDGVDGSDQGDPSRVTKTLRAMAERLSQVNEQLKGYKKRLKSLLAERDEEPPAELAESFELVESRMAGLARTVTDIHQLLGIDDAEISDDEDSDDSDEDESQDSDDDADDGSPEPKKHVKREKKATSFWW